jgi:alpha-tubulin suppressor-like RCC1 family protein
MTHVVGWGTKRIAAESVPHDFTNIQKIFDSQNEHIVFQRTDGTYDSWGGESDTGDAIDRAVEGSSLSTKTIEGGYEFAASLDLSGQVKAFDSSGLISQLPSSFTAVDQIHVGNKFVVARKTDNTVIAWSPSNSNASATIIPSDIGFVLAIDARDDYAVAVKTDGSVIAWGRSECGTLNVPADLTDVKAISAGGCSVIALKNDGTVISWGSDAASMPAGLSGITAIAAGWRHAMALQSDGTLVGWGNLFTNRKFEIPAGLSGVVSIAISQMQAMALKENGELVTWGALKPLSRSLNGAIKISCGAGFNLALFKDGTVTGWGYNLFGQADIPEGVTDVVDVAAGGWHSVVQKRDGTVIAWGSNQFGQTSIPSELRNPTKITAGFYHTLAISQSGTITGWGKNDAGQIPTTSQLGPAPIRSVAAYGDYTVFVRADGTIGYSGAFESSHPLVTPPAGNDYIAVSTGAVHAAALKRNGTVVAWGMNDIGQTDVPSLLNDVVDIQAALDGTVALTAHGDVVQWAGRMPTVPANLSSVIAIAAGYDYVFAIVDPDFQTPTPSHTPTNTTTPTVTATFTRTRTLTKTKTNTRTLTRSVTKSPTKTRTSTPRPTATLPPQPANLSFESGPSGWQASTSRGGAIIQRIPAIARNGSWLAIFGQTNGENAVLTQRFAYPKSMRTLSFSYRILSSEPCGYSRDTVKVYAGGEEVWKLDACTFLATTQWQTARFSVAHVTGKISTLVFEMKTDASNPSTWFVDQITFGR